MDERKEGVRISLLAWILVVIIVGVVGIVLIPPFFSGGNRGSGPRPGVYLKEIAQAEADFRMNDRDWNHVLDFWTGDVKGLYTMISAAVPGVTSKPGDQPLKLISLTNASSDADLEMVPAGGENTPLSQYALRAPILGLWWHGAMLADESGKPYRQDTGGKPPMGSCHNLEKFAFVCFTTRNDPRSVMIINESNMIRRIVGKPLPIPSAASPKSVKELPPAYANWPSDADLKKNWEPLD